MAIDEMKEWEKKCSTGELLPLLPKENKEQLLIKSIQAERIRSLRLEADVVELKKCLEQRFNHDSSRRIGLALKSIHSGDCILEACAESRTAMLLTLKYLDEEGIFETVQKKDVRNALIKAIEALENL